MASKKNNKDDFWILLSQAKSNKPETESDPEMGSQASRLSREEEEDYEAQASTEAESLAEIKKAQALSDAKFSKLKRRLLKERVKRQRQDSRMRKLYASKAYRFVWLWSVFFFLILLLAGFKKIEIKSLDFHLISEFALDPSVLIALITGVTVNIVAVFIIVMRNLFPSSAKEEKETAENEQLEKSKGEN